MFIPGTLLEPITHQMISLVSQSDSKIQTEVHLKLSSAEVGKLQLRHLNKGQRLQTQVQIQNTFSLA